MAVDASEGASLQLTFGQLRKVAVSAKHMHDLSPAEVLMYAAVNELKGEMSLDEATAIMQAAWSELE